jgi:hypothetical protein
MITVLVRLGLQVQPLQRRVTYSIQVRRRARAPSPGPVTGRVANELQSLDPGPPAGAGPGPTSDNFNAAMKFSLGVAFRVMML